jgi:hypothetical protein
MRLFVSSRIEQSQAHKIEGSVIFVNDSGPSRVIHLQVLQEVAEQVVQLAEDEAVLSAAPPIPKREMSFWMS